MIPNDPADDPEPPLVVVANCGSLRRGSFTRQALAIALRGAREVGARTHLIDLRDYRLGFCGDGDEGASSDDVVRLRSEVGRAQGILLGTPEYHGSFSGVLKNALDLMSFAEIQGKVIGLVGVSGGAPGANGALGGLRAVGRALHAWVIPEQASIPEAHRAFVAAETLRDPSLTSRLEEIGRSVARFAYLHSSKKARDLLRAWEEDAPTGVEPGNG